MFCFLLRVAKQCTPQRTSACVQVVRFPHKTAHSIWLEPEGLSTHTIYPSGLNTAFPPDVQVELLRSIRGLENVHMMRPGYAVEYEHVDPRVLKSTLESKLVDGLYFAGQINSSTGYEGVSCRSTVRFRFYFSRHVITRCGMVVCKILLHYHALA